MKRLAVGTLAKLLTLPLVCWIAAGTVRADSVTVFAAASLRNALEEIATEFRAEHGAHVSFSFAGSSLLARQISLGAPADVFISASSDWMDSLASEGFIESGTRFNLAGNELVLIGPGSSGADVTISKTLDINALLHGGKLAMALPDAVPAGIYGKAALAHFGLWEAAAPSVARTDNVRAALALVATGAAPAGIVYATDAMAEPRVTILGRFPAESHPPIRYPAAQIAGRGSPQVAEFLDYLRSDTADYILMQHGFVPVEE